MYCVRSLVPRQKKSATLASLSLTSAADGVSIITPRATFSAKGTPWERSSSRTWRHSFRASFTSHTEVTMGNMMLSVP